MPKSVSITISDEFSRVKHLKNRILETTDEQAKDAFALLSEYRDGEYMLRIIRVIVNGKSTHKGMSLFKFDMVKLL